MVFISTSSVHIIHVLCPLGIRKAVFRPSSIYNFSGILFVRYSYSCEDHSLCSVGLSKEDDTFSTRLEIEGLRSG